MHPLVASCMGPQQRLNPTLAYQDDALTTWAAWPGPAKGFSPPFFQVLNFFTIYKRSGVYSCATSYAFSEEWTISLATEDSSQVIKQQFVHLDPIHFFPVFLVATFLLNVVFLLSIQLNFFNVL